MAAPSLIGTTLGPYIVEVLIGHGGMASVFRGFDANLQRPVAIKVMAQDVAAQPGFVDRFRQEARLIANLHHPNIVRVYDMGQHGRYMYMVQELLPGPTLDQFLSQRVASGQQLMRQEIIAIIAQLASALDAAHAAGIIHRDVKPSNALWNASGALVLTDFGIAKNTLTSGNKTQTGMVVGTPHYLSPEQAQSLPLTPASDIYSLGVVLYELLAGKPPFDGDTPLGVVLNHIQTPPPPLPRLRSDLPQSVELVVQRALVKQPADRFGSAGEMARALEHAWQPAPAPNGGASSRGVHSQVTQRWQGTAPTVVAVPASPQPAPVASNHGALPLSVRQPAPQLPAQQPAALARTLPSLRQSFVPLLILGSLLFLMFLVGAVLVVRNSDTRTSGAPTPVASVIAETAVAAAGAPAPTAPLPTAGGAGAPPPASTDTAQPTALATPSQAGSDADLFAQLREALAAGDAQGQAQVANAALQTRLGAAQQALERGDAQTATQELNQLQKELLKGVRDGTIDPQVMRQALAHIAAIADRYGLALSLTVSS